MWKSLARIGSCALTVILTSAGSVVADECDQSDVTYSVHPGSETARLAGEYRAILGQGTSSERCLSVVINDVDGNRIEGTMIQGPGSGFDIRRDFEATVANKQFTFSYQWQLGRWVYEFFVTVKVTGPWKIRADWTGSSNAAGWSGYWNPVNVSRFNQQTGRVEAVAGVVNAPFVWPAWPKHQTEMVSARSYQEELTVLPSDVSIETPADDLDYDKRALSGVWEGFCGKRAVEIAVERVDETSAQVVYVAAVKGDSFTERVELRFVGDELRGTLSGGARLAFRLRSDGIVDIMWVGRNQYGKELFLTGILARKG
jgi:hypothetical protein